MVCLCSTAFPFTLALHYRYCNAV
uniref:Uncharacterized protein n=1 Tax=Anguilla anguilla TaxID=7936 RepID=A0A0E9T0V9_ANGAN